MIALPISPSQIPPTTPSRSEPRTANASRALFDGLQAEGSAHHAALDQLHTLLLRGAHHELGRHSGSLTGVSRSEVEDLAHHAAHDAMTAILVKLDTFRGESRFTTWAYKFVILEAGVKARRRAWRDREVTLGDEGWRVIGDHARGPDRSVETTELLGSISEAIRMELTPHQREVFTALALNEIPIDVLAERLDKTRGALYKTLHDARRKLRAALADSGYELSEQKGGEQ